MATISSGFILGLQRSNYRAEIPSICMIKSPNKTLSTNSKFRFGNVRCSQGVRKLPTVFAAEKDSSNQAGREEETDSTGQGPPFLTILAGFVVFLFICWIVFSLVMWIIGLIVNVPPS